MPCRHLWGGGLQAHTQGEDEGSRQGVSRPTPGASPGHIWIGSQGPRPGGSPGPHPEGLCVPACTEADPPMDGYCHRCDVIVMSNLFRNMMLETKRFAAKKETWGVVEY